MQGIMISLLTCSVTMSLLALLYMTISPLLARRYCVKWQYYAWLVVVIGLIIPLRPQWGNAIVQLDIPNKSATPIIQIMNKTETPDIPTDIEMSDITTVPIENAPDYPVWATISIWQIAAALWLIGVMAFLAYYGIKHYRFVKLANRWSEHIADERILNLFQTLKAEMKISQNINLYHFSCADSPMMFGLINPRIVLPTSKIAEDELRFVIKHELVHYKRKDLYYKFLVFIARAVHWFNPFVYLTARAVNEQCELSCDAEIVRDTNADTRLKYSEAIIGVVNYKSKFKTILSTNFYGGKKGMKKRISSIMDTGNKRMGIVIISIMLIATICTGFAFAKNQNDISDDISEFTDSDTKDGITVSVESVYGGNDTVFIKLKVETDDIVFDDNFEYSFGLWGIDFKVNPNDTDNNLINGGGTSIPVDKELWTEHVQYCDIKMSVRYGERAGGDESADFSLGDGNERVILLESFGYYNENYEWVKLSGGEWRLKFSYDTDDREIDTISKPFMFYGKGLMGDERPAQMTSVKLNKYGMECKYTAYEIQEALDFTADVIMKDGTTIKLTKGSMGCGVNLEGFMKFKTDSVLDLEKIAYVQICDEIIEIKTVRSQNPDSDEGYIVEVLPELVAATGTNGKNGYVYQKDLDGELPKNPEEAVEYMKRLQKLNDQGIFTRTIPLYESDGKTVIGEFEISINVSDSH